MKVNMDNLRAQMTASLNGLGRELLYHLPQMTEDDREDMVNAFSSLASYVATMNCIYLDEDENFNDIDDRVQVMDLEETLEAM